MFDGDDVGHGLLRTSLPVCGLHKAESGAGGTCALGNPVAAIEPTSSPDKACLIACLPGCNGSREGDVLAIASSVSAFKEVRL